MFTKVRFQIDVYHVMKMRLNQPMLPKTTKCCPILPILLNTFTNNGGPKKLVWRSGGPSIGTACRRPGEQGTWHRQAAAARAVALWLIAAAWAGDSTAASAIQDLPCFKLKPLKAQVNLARSAQAGPWWPGRLISTSSWCRLVDFKYIRLRDGDNEGKFFT